jgi:hypothetical protein
MEHTQSNEYAIYTRLVLPDSSRLNLITAYLPPATSLVKRNIPEEQALQAVQVILENI